MKSFADHLFDARQSLSDMEHRLAETVARWVGCEPDDDWPFDDVTHDYYDRSFELKEAGNDVALSVEAQREAEALGFQRCWLCHLDGSETYYVFASKTPGWKKARGASEYTRVSTTRGEPDER